MTTPTALSKTEVLQMELNAHRAQLRSNVRTFFLHEEHTVWSKKLKRNVLTRTPVVCIASILNAPKPDAKWCIFAVAQLNTIDKPLNTLGRHIATERLMNTKGTITIAFGPNLHRRITECLIGAPFSKRTQQAARAALARALPKPDECTVCHKDFNSCTCTESK